MPSRKDREPRTEPRPKPQLQTPPPTVDEPVGFLVFDVEAAGDGALIRRVRYPDERLTDEDAVQRFKDELHASSGSDVLPTTFVRPVAVCVAKVSPDYRLLDVAAVDEPHYRPSRLTEGFWKGWRHYDRPVLVTYNGRGYDLPVLELAAFRVGLSLPDWFNLDARSFEQNRNRYNTAAHLDLMDVLGNFGAARVDGGLNLLSHVLGKPGKSGMDGSKVDAMAAAGELAEINDYCRHDVLDTYFVFLRTRVLLGKITLEQEQERVQAAKAWLEDRAGGPLPGASAFASYLEFWGRWQKPA